MAEMIKRRDGSYSQRGLWDNIRANKGSGKKPTKEMLAQERKIKSEQSAYGGYIEVNPFLQEYNLGGFFGKGMTAGTGAGITGMAGSMLSGVIPTTKSDGTTSIGGSTAQGALKGFSSGAALGPIGMIGGAAIGGLTSLLQAKQQQEAEQEALLAKQNETSRNTLANMQYGVANASNLPMAMGGYTNDPPKKKYQESTLENIIEIFDPTGISSWNDVMDSYKNTGMSSETAIEIFGALPILGKAGKLGKTLLNATDLARIAASKNSKMGKLAAREAATQAGVGATLFSLPYIGRGTDAVQAVQQFPSAPILPEAPPKEVGQFGRYAGMNYAMGGMLNPIMDSQVGDFSNFATGGTHEQNPYGGIPQGYNSQGKLRTVEEGEAGFKFNEGKYIFSNRLTFE
jgi:hypothetical protein